jgi:hypothetical protein
MFGSLNPCKNETITTAETKNNQHLLWRKVSRLLLKSSDGKKIGQFKKASLFSSTTFGGKETV